MLRARLGETVGEIVESKLSDVTEVSIRLRDALMHGHCTGVRVISELKPASPSNGPLSAGDLTPDPILRAYIEGGATGISVLVEQMHFNGSFDLLRFARKVVRLPLLAKGFFFTPQHLADCVSAGADAFLLMVRVVESVGGDLGELIDIGERLGLDAVIEVSNEKELESALSAGAHIILVNARNIYSDLRIDLSNIAIAKNLPEDTVLVAASGITTGSDIEKVYSLSGCRVDAVLVGTSLMRSSDPKQAVGDLVRTGRSVVTEFAGVQE